MRVRALVVAAACSLAIVGPAQAKFRMTLAVAPAQPQANELVHVAIRADRALGRDAVMRLGAVAPGAALMDVVATVAGAPPSYPAPLRGSFAVRLHRAGASTWRGTLRFPRAGRWRLVVPNWGAPGYAMPPPLIRPVRVR